MAELADALDLGSSDFIVGVQVPSSAPKKKRNFDTKLRFFFFAQNCLNKGFNKKEKFPSGIYNRKKHSFYY